MLLDWTDFRFSDLLRDAQFRSHMPSAIRSLSGGNRTCRGQLTMSAIDPGCVKTCTSQECVELFSLSSSLSSGRKHFWFSNLRNRDGISTRRLNVGVFTQPRPGADLGPAKFLPKLKSPRRFDLT